MGTRWYFTIVSRRLIPPDHEMLLNIQAAIRRRQALCGCQETHRRTPRRSRSQRYRPDFSSFRRHEQQYHFNKSAQDARDRKCAGRRSFGERIERTKRAIDRECARGREVLEGIEGGVGRSHLEHGQAEQDPEVHGA